MRMLLFVATFAWATWTTGEAAAQIPILPKGAQTHWVAHKCPMIMQLACQA